MHHSNDDWFHPHIQKIISDRMWLYDLSSLLKIDLATLTL